MSKGGAYSLATRGAADVINASIPMIEQALSEMDLRGRTDFSVADMGCADGGTSLQMIETMIEQILSLIHIPSPRDYAASRMPSSA